MDTALSLCLGDTLDTVDTALVLEDTIDPFTRDGEDDFLVATSRPFAHARDLGSPATAFAVAYVHTVEVASEECCLITARTATDLHDHILSILRVCRDQEELDLLLERWNTLLSLLHHLTSHST